MNGILDRWMEGWTDGCRQVRQGGGAPPWCLAVASVRMSCWRSSLGRWSMEVLRGSMERGFRFFREEEGPGEEEPGEEGPGEEEPGDGPGEEESGEEGPGEEGPGEEEPGEE